MSEQSPLERDARALREMTEIELLEILRSEIGWKDGEKVTDKDLAAKYGVSHSYMNHVLNQNRRIGEKLSSAMGFDMVVTFKPKAKP